MQYLFDILIHSTDSNWCIYFPLNKTKCVEPVVGKSYRSSNLFLYSVIAVLITLNTIFLQT